MKKYPTWERIETGFFGKSKEIQHGFEGELRADQKNRKGETLSSLSFGGSWGIFGGSQGYSIYGRVGHTLSWGKLEAGGGFAKN